MNEKDIQEKLKALTKFDTPSITNVVASYPNKPEECLGLYNPWTVNWYTDSTIKCIYPELGPRVGYAVTCIYERPDPRFNRLSFGDVLKAVEASLKPVILVIKQNFPEEIKKKNGLSGGNMTTALKALGCIGCISDGPSRDIDEIRDMDFQYMLTGVCPGHGDFSVAAVNVPVSVCGMDIAPGELIHMDENGAVKFPADRLDDVLRKAEQLKEIEEKRMAKLRKAATAQELINILGGFEDSEDK